MKKILYVISLSAILVSCGHNSHGTSHHSHGASHHEESSVVAPKKKFVADAHLKKYMKLIKKEFISLKKSKKKDVKKFKKIVNKSIEGIVANCKLETKADNYLHISLGKIFEGIDSLENDNMHEATKSIHEAFEIYNKGFK